MSNDSDNTKNQRVDEIVSSLFDRLRKKGKHGVSEKKEKEQSVDIPLSVTKEDAERVFIPGKRGHVIFPIGTASTRKKQKYVYFFLMIIAVLFSVSIFHVNKNVRVVTMETPQEKVVDLQKFDSQLPQIEKPTTNPHIGSSLAFVEEENLVKLDNLQDCLMLRHYVDADKQSLRVGGQACVSVKFSGESFHIIGSSYQLVVFNEAPESDLSCGNLGGMNNTEEECQNFLKTHSYRDEIRIFVSEGSNLFVN